MICARFSVHSELEPIEETAPGVVPRTEVHQAGARSERVDRLEVERLLAPPSLLLGDAGTGSEARCTA